MDTADAVAKARARAPLVDILFRMSLRSVAANAKWVQKIFVVTDSPPSWLLSGAAGGRVTVVPTSAIMPADHLPTFNSHAVEANLHKVPGLSECYVYMNADYFFGRPSSLADFVDLEKGQYKIILEMDRTSAAASQLSRPPASHDAAFRNANMLLDGWAIANSNKGIERHFVPHAPHFFRKSLVEQLAAKAATQFSATSSHRFRSFEDVHVAYLHAYCAHPRRADLRTFPEALSALSRAPAQQNTPVLLVWVRARRSFGAATRFPCEDSQYNRGHTDSRQAHIHGLPLQRPTPANKLLCGTGRAA